MCVTSPEATMNIIAHIHTDFSTKFGIPRQSGIVPRLTGKIVFIPEYRHPDALRGLDSFSHLWLLWEFSETVRSDWSPTVRPPRLGGNKRMGVFATRSPFRPNPIGLSCVQLDNIEWNTPEGAVLHVSGIDLMNGTPIYDIKPYIAYTDSRPDASGGFTDSAEFEKLTVDFPESLLQQIPQEKQEALLAVLAHNPRPTYQNDPMRVYGLLFAGFDVRFVVEGSEVRVVEIG